MEKNQLFARSSLNDYIQQYASVMNCALLGLDSTALNAALSRIKQTADLGGTLFVAGNGGSAAIAEHLMCDFMKGAGLKVISLCSNVSLLTALANDIEYAEIFRAKLKMFGSCQRDCLFLISSSGNSPNVINAAKYAEEISMSVIGLTGFSGGELRSLSDVSLHISAHNYGIVEDSHQAIMHILTQWASIAFASGG